MHCVHAMRPKNGEEQLSRVKLLVSSQTKCKYHNCKRCDHDNSNEYEALCRTLHTSKQRFLLEKIGYYIATAITTFIFNKPTAHDTVQLVHLAPSVGLQHD